MVVDWRLLTFNCIEAAEIMGDGFAKNLAKEMYEHFTTLIQRETTPQERQKLMQDFENLCNEAYSLRLIMRRSKGTYQSRVFLPGTQIDDVDNLADIYGTLTNGTSGDGTRVAFTLFGALLKRRYREATWATLTKGQVITSDT